MKEKIHPEWYPAASVSCASCGTTWTTGSTVPSIRTDICSNCHPFYTGEQRIVDTEGQVDRFMKRLQVRDNKIAEVEQREAAKTPSNLSLGDLGVDKRYVNILAENNVSTAGEFISLLEARGEEALLEIAGIGRKSVADFKKALRNRGYDVPKASNE
ncbi:MAG: 50S ribosomal protein L31 [Chloroflexota bacterium]